MSPGKEDTSQGLTSTTAQRKTELEFAGGHLAWTTGRVLSSQMRTEWPCCCLKTKFWRGTCYGTCVELLTGREGL